MLKLLILIALAFGLMFGIVSKKKALKTIGMMLTTPVILIIGWGMLSGPWQELSSLEKSVAVVGGGLVILVILIAGTTFGREVLAGIVGHFIYDVMKTVVSLPSRLFRFLSRKF